VTRVFVANTAGNEVVKLTRTGVQSTLGFAGLSLPGAVAVDASGDVFVADTGNNRVVELTAGGVQTTLPFTGLYGPGGVALDGAGDVGVADSGNSTSRISRRCTSPIALKTSDVVEERAAIPIYSVIDTCQAFRDDRSRWLPMATLHAGAQELPASLIHWPRA
jgi:DNA-binding beta-propeller fold protein YncE